MGVKTMTASEDEGLQLVGGTICVVVLHGDWDMPNVIELGHRPGDVTMASVFSAWARAAAGMGACETTFASSDMQELLLEARKMLD
jgi:hypothetical protein